MSAPLCRAARVVAQRAPTSTATSVRCFSAEAALAPAKEGVSAISATPAPVAAPLPPVAKRGANLVDRVWAFLVGVGVGGIGFYYKLSEDVIESTAEIDTRIIGLRAEVSNSNEALRRRVATLENQLQEIQERLEKA